LKKVEIVDDFTVKAYWDKNQLDTWLVTRDFYILPEHLWKDFNKNQPAGMTMEDNQYSKEPVASGPYMIAEYEPDQFVIMTRNDNFYGGIPYLDSLVWMIMPDATAALLAFENGEVDTMHENSNFPQSEITRINGLPQFTVDAFPYTTSWRITINHHPDAPAIFPWLDDVKVLYALEYAINKPAIVENVLFGITKETSTAITWIVAPYGGDYNTADQGYTGEWEIVKRDYDPDMARQLMEEAGWTLNGDGVRHKVISGKDYTMDNIEVPTYAYATGWADPITGFWEDIGVMAQAVPIEHTTFVDGMEIGEMGMMIDTVGPFAVAFNTMGGGPDPDQLASAVESRNEWGPGFTTGSWNFGFYSNERVDELFVLGSQTAVYSERKPLYDEMQYLIHEDVGFIYLWNKWKIEAWNNDFAGFGSNRPIAWYGSFFRGDDGSSNLDRGVYWRGGTATPEGEVVTVTDVTTKVTTSVTTAVTTVSEFMGIQFIAMLSMFLIAGFFMYQRRKRKT
jgi:peptide/nickel transport system substrate-binding protein